MLKEVRAGCRDIEPHSARGAHRPRPSMRQHNDPVLLPCSAGIHMQAGQSGATCLDQRGTRPSWAPPMLSHRCCWSDHNVTFQKMLSIFAYSLKYEQMFCVCVLMQYFLFNLNAVNVSKLFLYSRCLFLTFLNKVKPILAGKTMFGTSVHSINT